MINGASRVLDVDLTRPDGSITSLHALAESRPFIAVFLRHFG